MPMLSISDSAEWLEADGLGGFASGTTSGVRTRRYHALLLTATTPPSGRTVLVNGLDAWIETGRGNYYLSSQRYAPDIINPDGMTHLKEFQLRPWPRFRFTLHDDLIVEQELFVPYGQSAVVLSWRLVGSIAGAVKLSVRPFLSGRNFHGTHHENNSFQFDPQFRRDRVRWKPYASLPAIVARSVGTYRHCPAWYRNFLYADERARGLDYLEDLASPGVFEWELHDGQAILTFSAEGFGNIDENGELVEAVEKLRAKEMARRQEFSSSLEAAADSYLARRGSERQSSRDIPGLAIGVATPLFHCEDCVSLPTVSKLPGISWLSGPAQSRGACYRIVSRIRGSSRNSTRLTHRSGM